MSGRQLFWFPPRYALEVDKPLEERELTACLKMLMTCISRKTIVVREWHSASFAFMQDRSYYCIIES